MSLNIVLKLIFARWFYCNNASLTGCPSGSFGVACREKCKCLADHTERCDPKDGTCDCKPGYLGKRCLNSKFSFSNLLQRGVKLRVFSRFFWWKEKLQRTHGWLLKNSGDFMLCLLGSRSISLALHPCSSFLRPSVKIDRFSWSF